MPIQSGQVGRYGIKATPDILGPHRGIPWRSPALSNAQPTINGRTHDSTGAILGSCTVWAMNTQSDTVMGTTTSDADGLFSLTLYTSGSYYLVAYKAGPGVGTSSLPAQITLSRASSGTYYDSSGLVQTAATDTARFDYVFSGGSWVAAGLLIEEQRLNNLAPSIPSTAPTPPYTWFLLLSATETDNAAISPDGTSNASSVTYSAGNSGIYTNHTLTGIFTVSVSAKVTSGTGTFRFRYFDTFFGDLYSPDMTVTTAWQRFTYTWTPTGLGASNFVIINGSAGAVQTILLYGAQLEQGGFATSYIPTTTAPATRSADIVSSTDATLLAAQGWVVEVGELPGATASTLLGINTVIGLGATSGDALTTADGGTQTTANTGTWTSQNRGGLAFDSAPRVSIDLNGGTVVTAANAPATVTNLYFGNTNNGASGFLNGHIRMMAAYSAITDAQLPGLSTVDASFTSVITPTFSVRWVAGSADVSGTTVNTLIPT